MTPELQPLLTVDDAAKVLGVHPVTVRKWIAERAIPFVRLGRAVRFRPCDLAKYIEKHLQRAVSA